MAMVLCLTNSGIVYIARSLQGYVVDSARLGEQAVAQAFLIPPLYAVASLVRKRFLNYEYGI